MKIKIVMDYVIYKKFLSIFLKKGLKSIAYKLLTKILLHLIKETGHSFSYLVWNFFNKFTDYIKCIVTINYNIINKIVFYCNSNDFIITPESSSSSKNESSSSSVDDCNPPNNNIRYNETYFVFSNIFKVNFLFLGIVRR
jgi:hypothetical protein